MKNTDILIKELLEAEYGNLGVADQDAKVSEEDKNVFTSGESALSKFKPVCSKMHKAIESLEAALKDKKPDAVLKWTKELHDSFGMLGM